jgi:hypothetical protein
VVDVAVDIDVAVVVDVAVDADVAFVVDVVREPKKKKKRYHGSTSTIGTIGTVPG